MWSECYKKMYKQVARYRTRFACFAQIGHVGCQTDLLSLLVHLACALAMLKFSLRLPPPWFWKRHDWSWLHKKTAAMDFW